MKFWRNLALTVALLSSGPALAQSTAAQVVTGYLTTSGCPTGSTVCFVQYGASGGPGGVVSGNQSNASSAVAATSTNVGTVAYLYAWNGTTWDQLQVDGSKFLKVNCATGCSGGTFNNNSDAVATSATNGQSAAWLYAWNGTGWDRLQDDGSKFLKVNVSAALPAGSAIVGKVGIDQTTPGTTNGVTPVPATAGGLTIYSANVTNAALAVKASAGQYYSYHLYNNNSSVCYLQLFNATQGSVTVGTTAPTESLGIPANGGAAWSDHYGVAYGTAITVAATTTRTGSTACTNGIDTNIRYK